MKQLKITIILSLLFLISACKIEKKGKIKVNLYDRNTKILDLEFPDTLLINHDMSGKIIYNMKIDTLKKADISNRFIFLYVTTDKQGIDIHTIKQTNHKIFIDTIGNGKFKFKGSFNNTGNNILNLVFEDVVMTNKLKKGKVFIYKVYTSISLPVFVKKH